MDSKCWVEFRYRDGTFMAIRIFRNKKATAIAQAANPEIQVCQMNRALAVGQIRRQVFFLAEYKCEMCGTPVRWSRGFQNSGEMDEKQARGECLEQLDGNYKSGEQSVENGQCLCKDCHRIKTDREPQFSKATRP